MPNYQKRIVYLSDAQYQQLILNGSITVDGVTITYSDSDVYVTPMSAGVTMDGGDAAWVAGGGE